MTTAQTNIAKGFDIDNLDAPSSNRVTYDVPVIFNADGDPVSGFAIVGKNSEEYRAASNAVRVDNTMRAAKRGTQIDTSTQEGAQVLVNTIERKDRQLALAVVVGWFGFTSGGKEKAFDKAYVEKMFDKYPTWQDKVLAALEQDGNFMKV